MSITPGIATLYAPFNNPNEVNQCKAVVVGSGFGGTIVSLSGMGTDTSDGTTKLQDSWLGINSSLTISALAFRIAENIVGSPNFPVEPVTVGGDTIYFSK
jgi:hypothetical protein